MSVQWRGHAATVLVAGLSGAFGVGLLAATEIAAAAAGADPHVGDSTSVRIALSILAVVFSAIAIYVSAIVTTNTVATIVTGRLREIALTRLLGGTAARERGRLAREGLIAGTVGAVLGGGTAIAIAAVAVAIGRATGVLPDVGYPPLTATMLIPFVAVILATWLAAWVGSRRVLTVTPAQALGAAVPMSGDRTHISRRRRVATTVLLATGLALLALGVVIGLVDPMGMLISLLGGLVSFTGLLVGAVLLLPPMIRLMGRVLVRGAASRFGVSNAIRHPERAARSAIGLVIGVALVTMFVVASETLAAAARAYADTIWDTSDPIEPLLTSATAVLVALAGFSAVIAGVGLVNALNVGVLQRTREFGLLRALGFSRAQVRTTITVEAVQLTGTALLVGLGLGILYGWVGAQSLVGSATESFIPPVISGWYIGVIALVAAALALAGSLLPARRALRISVVAALAQE